MIVVGIKVMVSPCSPSLSSPGGEAGLVQLALLPALPPSVASAAQESERTFRQRRPLLLPVPKDPTLLQRLPVPGDGGLHGAASGVAPSRAGRETLLHWTGAPHRRRKLCYWNTYHTL